MDEQVGVNNLPPAEVEAVVIFLKLFLEEAKNIFCDTF